jgi:hypothetical protein
MIHALLIASYSSAMDACSCHICIDSAARNNIDIQQFIDVDMSAVIKEQREVLVYARLLNVSDNVLVFNLLL